MEGEDINQLEQNLIGREGKKGGRHIGKSNCQVMSKDISQLEQHLISQEEKKGGCQV